MPLRPGYPILASITSTLDQTLIIPERSATGQTDTRASIISPSKPEPSSSTAAEDEPLELGSWLTLHQGDGPPRTAIRCFEPKPKRARELQPGDVFLDLGAPCRVVDTPGSPDASGLVALKVWDLFAAEEIKLVAVGEEEMTMVATVRARYGVVWLLVSFVNAAGFACQRAD